jgi:heat shock protein HtpX
MFIVNPLRGGSLMGLFSTHPPLEERIARLTGEDISGGHQPDPDRGRKEAEATWKKLSG